MADITVKTLDELSGHEGMFLHAGKDLGVSSFGMNVMRLPAAWGDYPDHDHASDGQEEVYVVLSGSATLQAGDERWELAPGMLARVGPERKRKLTPGAQGVTLLALGGTPGSAFGA